MKKKRREALNTRPPYFHYFFFVVFFFGFGFEVLAEPRERNTTAPITTIARTPTPISRIVIGSRLNGNPPGGFSMKAISFSQSSMESRYVESSSSDCAPDIKKPL